ncbi:hypothetical protein ACFC4M_29100, partial [Streptomyces sp. NPDC056019]|uniref:hypothetical protein n=1 Tax=Streptomyces sp. NPDC056019 TaxID=3345681 RepID=UPI0035E157DA
SSGVRRAVLRLEPLAEVAFCSAKECLSDGPVQAHQAGGTFQRQMQVVVEQDDIGLVVTKNGVKLLGRAAGIRCPVRCLGS